MAYDEGLADLIRQDMIDEPGMTEQKMFGGLAFLRYGHMVAGVHRGGAMFRVGKASETEALAVSGARPMTFTGRPMPGMIETDDECAFDDDRRARLLSLALGFVRSLPPK